MKDTDDRQGAIYTDVHTHLVHRRFAGEEDAVAERAAAAGLCAVVVNGLDPVSNRAVLALCSRHRHLLPAVGLYPVDAVADHIDRANWKHDWPPPEPYDIQEELDYIDSVASEVVAIGECGLDGYWVPETVDAQEEVLRSLVEIALSHDLPLIVHTRKAERRAFEILCEMGVKRADFHCYGGNLRLAKEIAMAGYHLSVPPVVERSQAFQRLVEELPLSCLLTETDAPYMGPDRGERNEPANVPRAVAAMARLKGLSEPEMAAVIRANFRTLIGV